MVVEVSAGLVGRDDELLRLRRFLSGISEGPCAIVVRGKAGIGKTTLWRAALESEEAAGLTLLRARAVEAELPLALVGLSDLVLTALPAVSDALAERERSALALALGLEVPADRPRDAIELPRAFLALLRLLARDGPVVVAIDDVQWLDAPSARAVAFAARRLGDAPIGFLVTQRGDGPDPLSLAHAVGETRYEELRLGALTLGALAHLVRARFDVRVPRPALARVHEASGGNPMFALEFARSLVGREQPHLGPMPIPASLQDIVRARMEQYPEAIRRLLALVAAAGRPTAEQLATVDAGLLDAALDTGAVTVGDDGVISFTHPLLASAVYAELPPSERRALHARLADVAEDVEERGRHLALASAVPDGTTAAALDEAAIRASARGAPEAAAELAHEAVRLTPSADDSDRHERELAVAVYLGAAGRLVECAAWLDRLLASGLVGPRRAETLLLRVGAIEHDIDAGGRALAEALEHVGDDLHLRARALLQISGYHFYSGDFVASEDTARQALAAAEGTDDPALLATTLAAVATRAEMAGHPEEGLLERAIALADVYGTTPFWGPPIRELLGRRLLRKGDLDGARKLLTAELAASVRSGIEPDRYRILRDLTDVESRAGNWQVAERYLNDAWECAVADNSDNPWPQAELLERKARLAALRGDVDEARSVVAQGIACADAMHWAHQAATNRWILGFLELSLDEPTRAWQMFQDVPRTTIWGRPEVSNAVADTVETLVALDQLEAADELLAALHDDTRNGNQWSEPAALRCSALLLLARGDALAAVATADEAADRFEALGCPLDRGRALLVAGEALRRAGKRRRAAEKIEAAKGIFTRRGAALWAERAERELQRARPRPRRDRELTNAERQVAELVAAGSTNREVSAQLFTTVATVEAHLTRIYRKLGVRSRTQLARGVADGTISLAE